MEESCNKDWMEVISDIYKNKREIKNNVVDPYLDNEEEGFTENQKYIIELVRELDDIYYQLCDSAFNSKNEAENMLNVYREVKTRLMNELPTVPEE